MAYMAKKVSNIQRIINNDILKIVNIVFSGAGGGGGGSCPHWDFNYSFLFLNINFIVLLVVDRRHEPTSRPRS